MKPSEPLYRPILQQALKTAWLHKELWPLAAVAGIAGTGTVLNDVIGQGQSAFAFPQTGAGAFSFISFLEIYFSHLVFATPNSALASFFLFSMALLVFISIIMFAQHVMLTSVHRAAMNKKRLSFKEIMKNTGQPHLIRLFVINAFFKLLIVNSLLVGALLLGSLNTQTVITDAFFGFVFACAIVAFVFAVNVCAVFSLIHATKDNEGIVAAMKDAWKMFADHPAVALEMSAVLFGVNFLMTIAYAFALVALAVPFLFLFGLSVTAGSLTAISAVTILFVLTLLTATICMAGFITTFTLSAWTELVIKLEKAPSPVKGRLHAHLKQLHGHLS